MGRRAWPPKKGCSGGLGLTERLVALTPGASPWASQNPGKESAKGAPRTAQKSPEGGTSTGRILGLKIFLGKKGRGVISAGIFPENKIAINKKFEVGSGPGIYAKGGESRVPGFPLSARGQVAFRALGRRRRGPAGTRVGTGPLCSVGGGSGGGQGPRQPQGGAALSLIVYPTLAGPGVVVAARVGPGTVPHICTALAPERGRGRVVTGGATVRGLAD